MEHEQDQQAGQEQRVKLPLTQRQAELAAFRGTQLVFLESLHFIILSLRGAISVFPFRLSLLTAAGHNNSIQFRLALSKTL
jgi:hypothetical protein